MTTRCSSPGETLSPCEEEFELGKRLADFPAVVLSAAENYEPSYIARYLVDVAQRFNKFYIDCKIMTAEPDVRLSRLALTEAALVTLRNGLGLLGIGAPEKM